MNVVNATAGGSDGARAGGLDGETRDAKKSVLLRARLFVFSALFAICKDVEPSFAIVLASKVVEFLQLVSFPMDAASAYPWNAGSVSWLSSISLAFRLCTLDLPLTGCGGPSRDTSPTLSFANYRRSTNLAIFCVSVH